MIKNLILLMFLLTIVMGCNENNNDVLTTKPRKPKSTQKIYVDPISKSLVGPANEKHGSGSFWAGYNDMEEVKYIRIMQRAIRGMSGYVFGVDGGRFDLPDGRSIKFADGKCLLILVAKDETVFTTYLNNDAVPLAEIERLFKNFEELESSDDYFKTVLEVLGKDRFDEDTLKFLSTH